MMMQVAAAVAAGRLSGLTLPELQVGMGVWAGVCGRARACAGVCGRVWACAGGWGHVTDCRSPARGGTG